MRARVMAAIQMDVQHADAIRRQARAWYLANDAAFRRRASEALQAT